MYPSDLHVCKRGGANFRSSNVEMLVAIIGMLLLLLLLLLSANAGTSLGCDDDDGDDCNDLLEVLDVLAALSLDRFLLKRVDMLVND